MGALLVFGAVPGLAAVARFDTAEIVLHSAAPYNGAAGSPNPFTDVQLTAQVTSPGGRRFTVDGFFDGNGTGGQSGDVFKVRVFADEAGTWSWTTASNAAGLHGQAGTFVCSGTLAGTFAQGPVEVNPIFPRSLRHRQGEPVYLVGKYLDRAAPVAIRFSHTLLSEERTDSDRRALLDRHLGMGLNKINIYLANRTDYGGVSTTPWLGTADANDKARFDLARWALYERWVRELRAAGVVAQLWFFADGSGYGDLPEAERKRLIQYGMARLSGYASTMFTLMTEWQEQWTAAEVDTHMTFLQQHNPWDRLASVHGLPGDFSFPGASWADYIDLQAGLSPDVTHATVHALGLENRASAVKPMIQEEFWMGDETDGGRKMLWAAFTSGSAGSGTGAFLGPFGDFVATVPFERMEPADALVLSGGAYALAETGESYVVYLYDGGSVSVDLRGTSGSFAVAWFDPRLGAFQAAPAVAGGAARSFTAPAAGDWVLRLTATDDPPPPPPPPPAGITVSPTSGLITSELGGTATFQVVLTAQPTANVVVSLASSDTTEGTVSPASLTFTSSNWSTVRTVTVTGVNDTQVDGDVGYQIVTSVASSDSRYAALNPADIGVTNRDDDSEPPPPPTERSGFYTLRPCRLLDTREAAHGPALASGEVRPLDATGRCGLPATAAALSVNVTVVDPTGQGHVALAPGGKPLPIASTVNFSPGQTRANNAILAISTEGVLQMGVAVAGAGTVHLIVDVNGWFE